MTRCGNSLRSVAARCSSRCLRFSFLLGHDSKSKRSSCPTSRFLETSLACSLPVFRSVADHKNFLKDCSLRIVHGADTRFVKFLFAVPAPRGNFSFLDLTRGCEDEISCESWQETSWCALGNGGFPDRPGGRQLFIEHARWQR